MPPVGCLTLILIRDLIALSEGQTGVDTAQIGAEIADLTGQQIDLTETINTIGEGPLAVLFVDVAAVVSFGLRLALRTALMLFIIYYLLRGGTRVVDWVITVAPMGSSVCRRLFRQVDNTTPGVVRGHLLVAVLQRLVGGIGLFVAHIPSVVFLPFAIIVLALLSLVETFLVWAPTATCLVAVGQGEAGVLLFVHGLVVVSLVDNYTRPLLIDREAHLNPAIILIGVFDGTYALGVTGLFLGPVVLAVFSSEYDALSAETREDRA